MALLYFISYAALAAAFVFVTLSLASGLLYVSELIEEHSRLAKVVGQRGLYVVILLHVLLYFFDSLPFVQTAFSILCHIVYLQNFSTSWPLISLSSPSFLASCVLVLVDHFTWFFYFARITHESRSVRTYRGLTTDAPGFTEIASFFAICVWLVPLFLFLSLSANDNTLPMSAAEPGTPTSSGFSQTGQTRVSLIRSMFSLFSFDMVSRARSKAYNKDNSEGLIAPRSPTVHQHPLSMPSSPMLGPSPRIGPPQSPISRYNNQTPPPRSPVPRIARQQEHDALGFSLGTPPKGRSASIVRRQTSDVARRSLMRPAASDDDKEQ